MKIKLEKFEGPLDLLLKLIEEEEMEIVDVNLAEVAEQYISYLDKIEIKDPEHLADFLVIAVKLLHMKSKVLLPDLDLGGDEDYNLEEQLKLYKKYYDASKVIEGILGENKYMYSRPEELKSGKIKYMPAKNLNGNKLKIVFMEILKGLEEVAKIPKQSMEKVVSIKEKIQEIRDLLKDKDLISFKEMLGEASNKTDVIVSFLGMLELVKQRVVVVRQSGIFGEVEIKKLCQ